LISVFVSRMDVHFEVSDRSLCFLGFDVLVLALPDLRSPRLLTLEWNACSYLSLFQDMWAHQAQALYLSRLFLALLVSRSPSIRSVSVDFLSFEPRLECISTSRSEPLL
jgi:hypothetical protein